MCHLLMLIMANAVANAELLREQSSGIGATWAWCSHGGQTELRTWAQFSRGLRARAGAGGTCKCAADAHADITHIADHALWCGWAGGLPAPRRCMQARCIRSWAHARSCAAQGRPEQLQMRVGDSTISMRPRVRGRRVRRDSASEIFIIF